MHPIRSLVLYEGLASAGIGMTAATGSLLQLQVGMTVADIAFVNIVFWLTVILAELPTGMLADGRGRIWSVRLGIAFLALSCFAYAGVQGVGTALVAEVAMGIGHAFISGAESAWVTDALKKRKEEHLTARAFGSQAMASAVGFLVGGVAGGLLGAIELRLGWIGAGILVSCSAVVAWRVMDDAGEIADRPSELEALRLSCEALRARPALLWTVAATVAFGLVVPFNHLWQPYFVDEVGQAGLGLLCAPIQASMLFAGWLVRRRGAFGGGGAAGIALAVFICGAGLVAVASTRALPATIVAVMIHEFGRGLFRPLMNAYTQARVESRFCATFGSLQSLLGKTGFALALALVWLLSDGKDSSKETISFIWIVSGSLLTLGAGLLWKARPRET
jgi:hypothetical protein